MPINKQWHLKNRMPKNPKLEERLKWHKAHTKHCACRPMPEKLRALIKNSPFNKGPACHRKRSLAGRG